ncbi:Glutamate receptor ionotropic, kainate 3 [Araneus ventricosus]|uniref:Glutamate receptor ionotropic, kainate 3 n=1 Tax=Araneus ventricosus TaxID=182803 RepID=A0A4Y2N412_ARAVE|nr:Glutamate receptor ionotropic, kainate 3 [Araneus ventricosus]
MNVKPIIPTFATNLAFCRKFGDKTKVLENEDIKPISLVGTEDVHTVNLEDFQYIGTNITGFRIVNQSPEYQEIVQDWKASHAAGKPLDGDQAPYAKTDVALMYDAVWTFATALNTLEKGQRLQIKSVSCETEKPWAFGPTLANHMRGVELRGLTGRIVFDENGMRTNFTVKIQDLTHIGLTESLLQKESITRWQKEWDNGETGRSVHNVLPKVKTTSTPWQRPEIMFVTGHGPFPTYLKRFNIRSSDSCGCGKLGNPLHYATSCLFTTSYHLTKPSADLEPLWWKRVMNNNNSRAKIKKLMHFIAENEPLLFPKDGDDN